MTRGTKEQRSPIELDGLVEVRWDITQRESVSEPGGKVVER
jgi:hypothetical protein